MERRNVITGANSGIGLHITHALLDRGGRVAALDLSKDQPEGAFERGSSDRLRCYSYDVSSPGSVFPDHR